MKTEISKHVNPFPPTVLLATSADREKDRQVKTFEGANLAKMNGWSFFEVSALTGQNIKSAFISLVKQYQNVKPAGNESPVKEVARSPVLAKLQGRKMSKGTHKTDTHNTDSVVSGPFNLNHKLHVDQNFNWNAADSKTSFEIIRKLGEG